MRASTRVAVLVLALGGCGRVAFDIADVPADAPPCVPIGHDEDGDGLDDACDVCPHIAGDQTDSDGDGVGDACDPHPMEPRDHIVFFDPFTGPRTEWTYPTGSYTFAGDRLLLDARLGQFHIDLAAPPVTDTYVLGGTIRNGNTTQHQVALLAVEDGSHFYYCELNGSASSTAAWQETVTRDDVAFDALATSRALGPIADRDFMVVLTHAPPALLCRTDWPLIAPDAPDLEAPIPTDIHPTGFVIGVIGVIAELTYFVHIHSD